MKHTIPSSPILALLFPILAGLLLHSTPAAAVSVDARQWDITADKMTRYENPARIVAEGNVLLEKKEPVEKRAPKTSSAIPATT